MGFFQRLFSRWKRQKSEHKTEPEEQKKSFLLYIGKVPEILTYMRRARGIPRKKLELVLVDHEEYPAYQIAQVMELLMRDLNLFYLVTERPETFEELAEEALEQQGLLVTFLDRTQMDHLPGNLVLDLHDWEKQLDIISAVSYNTVIM